MIFYLDPDIKSYFSNETNLFDRMMALKGKIFRALENRRTQQITFNNQTYFIKQHFGVGLKEIIKNLLQGRLPIISAKNEWLAIQKLNQLKIATPVIKAYGSKGLNPASVKSFILTEELPPHTSLEHFCENWASSPPTFKLKKRLLSEVAHIAKTLHENGINHRDFYLCHFLLLKNAEISKLILIDLHRAQIRKKTPTRWSVKDIAGLYFSSRHIGLTTRDDLRFIKAYRNQPLRDILLKEKNFWQRVKQRGDQLSAKHKR